MDLNFKSLNRKICDEDLKCLISFVCKKKERFHSSAFTTQKSFHPNPMDNSWKTVKSILFPTRKTQQWKKSDFFLGKEKSYVINFDQKHVFDQI